MFRPDNLIDSEHLMSSSQVFRFTLKTLRE